jgi:hypothetical protein
VTKDDPFVTMHFDVATAGRPFARAGLIAVTELLLGKLWNLALSPWKISAGVLTFSQAHQVRTDVHKIWGTTREPKSEREFSSSEEPGSSASQTIH